MATYSVEQFSEDKALPLDLCTAFGLRNGEDTLHHKDDDPHGRWKKGDPFVLKGILFPYTDDKGIKQHRIRTARSGKNRFCWGSDYKHQMLFGLNVPPPSASKKQVVLTEGESCALTGRLLGLQTLGIAGAPYGWEDHFKNLPVFQNAEEILVIRERKRADLTLDKPDAGGQLVERVAQSFPAGKVRAVRLHKLAELANADVKDISDLWLYCRRHNPLDPEAEFASLWQKAVDAAIQPGMEWRDHFYTLAELKSPPPRELIKGVLIEGLVYNGAGSCVGKTWKTMSEACALRTGRKFAGAFEVPERVPVIYLMAEQGNGSVYRRGAALRMPFDDPNLLFHTLSHGVLSLNDQALLSAVRHMRPVIFVDTAVRFAHVNDENSSAENASGLYAHMSELMRAGALCVSCNHHTTKQGIRNGQLLELEDLRGTGDIGAMCDLVWMIQTYRGQKGSADYFEQSKKLTRILCRNVKPREIETPPFVLVGRPNIDRDGDFGVLDETVDENPSTDSRGPAMAEAVRIDPKLTNADLASRFGVSRNDVPSFLAEQGFRRQGSKGPWIETPRLIDSGVDADEPL